jgi:hypothetical protein
MRLQIQRSRVLFPELPLSLVMIIEEVFERKRSGCGVENADYRP